MLCAILLLVGAAIGTGIPVIDSTASGLSELGEEAGFLNSTGGDSDALNRSAIERQVHQSINQVRVERGLSELQSDQDLREVARYHSEDMADRGYFAHEGPDGETMGDRYDRFGYDCEVALSENRYATGGENIAYTYAYGRIRADDGRIISHDGDESHIGRGIVRQWMNSTGHRENIVKPHWRSEGIGVAFAQVEEGTRVYVTQNFC